MSGQRISDRQVRTTKCGLRRHVRTGDEQGLRASARLFNKHFITVFCAKRPWMLRGYAE